jgi:hypothetical protein
MEGHLEALLEMYFCTKPPNFGVETHMEAPAGDALRREKYCSYGNRPSEYFVLLQMIVLLRAATGGELL